MRKLIINIIFSVILIFTMVTSTNMQVFARGDYTVTGFNGIILYYGPYDECKIYMDYASKYESHGSGYNTITDSYMDIDYTFGKDKITFDFETGYMTWIDGTKVKITYQGPLSKDYLRQRNIPYADDALKVFCPEFAATHSLIPEGYPDNFLYVIDKARKIMDERLGTNREAVMAQLINTAPPSQEEFEKFDAVDYATRYPDIKEVFGTDKELLWNHYQTYGKLEGRTAKFN